MSTGMINIANASALAVVLTSGISTGGAYSVCINIAAGSASGNWIKVGADQLLVGEYSRIM